MCKPAVHDTEREYRYHSVMTTRREKNSHTVQSKMHTVVIIITVCVCVLYTMVYRVMIVSPRASAPAHGPGCGLAPVCYLLQR